MEKNEQEEVVVDTLEETNEEVTEQSEETTEEAVEKTEKPKRTPQEEYEYHMGRAKRAAKKAGIELEERSEPVKSTTSDKPSELDMGAIAYLNSLVGLKGKDEIALARQYVAAGKSVLDLPDNKFFKQDLEALREARESSNAIPKGKNRSTQSAVTDVDIAVSKYRESGELPTDFATRNKVIDIITKEEKGDMFSSTNIR